MQKKYKIPLVISCLGLSSLLLFTYLTFIPKQTFAITMPDPGELRTLSQIDTMQQMSQQICINSREHETKQLKDSRDDKLYWVTKLKDGNCWMTQNLDYNIPETLNSETSNVMGDSIPTGISSATSISNWPDGDSVFKGYTDPGNYVYTYRDHGPVPSNSCTGITDNLDNPKCIAYFTKLTDSNANMLDTHYHIGNYYSWSAATVGFGDGANLSGISIEQSICPKGWKIPTSNSTSDGSFGYMLSQYGLQKDLASDNYSIYDDPVYFLYGGGIGPGSMDDVGWFARYWSSTMHSKASSAYDLTITTDVDPSHVNDRFDGFSLRCLAMGGWLDSYPDPNDQANVAIVVAPVISIDVTKHADKMETDFTHVAKDTITARVGANQPYQVLISTKQSDLLPVADEDGDSKINANDISTNSTEQLSSTSIPMLSKEGKIVASISGWGIGKDSDIKVTRINGTDGSSNVIQEPTITTDTVYYPVGIEPSKALFYTSSSAATEILEFPVAIGISSTVPTGTYATQVTLTAVAD